MPEIVNIVGLIFGTTESDIVRVEQTLKDLASRSG
jgi:hypothetical protein